MGIEYKEGYKYVLAEDYTLNIRIKGYSISTEFIGLDVDGNLRIKRQYAWDGATMFPDLRPIIRPSLLHDALCQLIRSGLLPKNLLVTVHKIFKDEIEKDIKSLSDSWKYYGLPALAYNGLLLSGKLGQGFDNKIKTAP